jgi:hypothetical protein
VEAHAMKHQSQKVSFVKKSNITTMLITFLGKDGVIHKEFCLKGSESVVLSMLKLSEDF